MSEQTERPTLIEAVGLSYAYRASSGKFFSREGTNVIENVSFKLRRGDTLGIVGRNGVGKSTLLRVLAGIFEPAHGALIVTPEATIGLLALGVGFNGFLTGRDNAIQTAVLMGYTVASAERHLEEIKEFSELGDAFEKPVRTYSSGMRSRLSFSTLLYLEIDVLLIDEVLAVGDGHFKQKAKRALREKINGEQTVVLVSHALNEITELCDQAVWLSNRRMEMVGSADDVVRAYAESL